MTWSTSLILYFDACDSSPTAARQQPNTSPTPAPYYIDTRAETREIHGRHQGEAIKLQQGINSGCVSKVLPRFYE